MRVVDCLGYINRCCGKRWIQLTAYGTCTAVRNVFAHHPARYNFHIVHSNLGSSGELFCFGVCRCIYWAQIFAKNFRCATRRGIASFTLWTAVSGRNRGITGAQPGHKERGGPHTQRPTPHVPGTVIGAASHRYPEFHGRCRRDEESSTTLWCLLARFSRLFPPALSGSDVRLKETGGKRRKLVFPERLRGTLRCPR